MSTPSHPRAQRGDRNVSANLLNAHSEGIERLGDLAASPYGGFDFGTFTAAAETPESFLAWITGTDGSSPPAYSWERLAETKAGGTELHPDGAAVSGSLTYQPAYEETGNPNVPIGAVVRLWRSRDGFEYRWFTYDALTSTLSDNSVLVAPTYVLSFPVKSYALIQTLPHRAEYRPRWGLDTQPVGLVTWNGNVETFSRSNHIHAGRPSAIAIINNFSTTIPPPVFPPGFQNFYKDDVNKILYFKWSDGTECKIPMTDCVSPPPPPAPADCEPGICTYCDDPPGVWRFAVDSFAGDCLPFNGAWALRPATAACTWAQTIVAAAGGSSTATLVLAAGVWTLTFTVNGPLGALFSATFTADGPVDGDCCVPITLEKDECDCGAGAPVAGCAGCAEAPALITVTITSCDGDAQGFNGVWQFSRSDVTTCEYFNVNPAPPAGVSFQLLFISDGATPPGFRLELQASVAGGDAVWETPPLGSNCCAVGPMNLGGSTLSGTIAPSISAQTNCGSASSGGLAGPASSCSQCLDGTPLGWTVHIAGYAGVLAPCNGDWLLSPGNLGDCVWTQVKPFSGTLFSQVSLTKLSTGKFAAFVQYSDGSFSEMSTWSSAANAPCCQNLLMTVTGSDDVAGGAPQVLTFKPSCAPGAGSTGPPCSRCPGVTPRTWSVHIAGFPTAGAGALFGVYNGDWVLLPGNAGECIWNGQRGELHIGLYLTPEGYLTAILDGGPALAVYGATQRIPDDLPDCCSPVLLVIGVTYSDLIGTGPLFLQFVPDCAPAPGGGGSTDTTRCPAEIEALPECCTTVCDCDECPDGAPFTWTFTAAGFTGAACTPLNGDWELSYGGGCAWVAVKNDTSATLVVAAGVGTLTFHDALGAVLAVYTLDPWVCCGPNTLTVAVDNCTTSPGALDLTASGPCGPCPAGIGVETGCCVSNLLPGTLYLAVTAATGACSCLVGARLTLLYSVGASSPPDNQVWLTPPFHLCDQDCYFRLECASGVWNFSVASCTGPAVEVAGTVCNPLSLTFDIDNTGVTLCEGTYRVVITETPLP